MISAHGRFVIPDGGPVDVAFDATAWISMMLRA
jgi:hypothetical protein